MGSVSPSGGRYINTTTNPVSVTFKAKQEQSKISLQIPLHIRHKNICTRVTVNERQAKLLHARQQKPQFNPLGYMALNLCFTKCTFEKSENPAHLF